MTNLDHQHFEKVVILDPTGLYQPPEDYIIIDTEVKWMQSFFVQPGRYWVTGKGQKMAKRLCDWTQEWLDGWNQIDAIAEIKKETPLNDALIVNPTPILVQCQGEGEAKKPGKITVTIENTHSVSLSQVYLYIEQINLFKNGYLITDFIAPNQRTILEIDVNEYPELPFKHPGQKLSLSGYLSFWYNQEKQEKINLNSQSFLTIQQLYKSGFFEESLNEFL